MVKLSQILIFFLFCTLNVSAGGDLEKADSKSLSKKKSIASNGTNVKQTIQSPLEKLSKKYSQISSARMELTKKVKNTFLDQVKTSRGQLLIKKEKLRMDLDGELAKTLILVNKNKTQVFTYPKEKKMQPQVLEISASESKKTLGHKILSSLLLGKDLEKLFLLEKQEKQGQFLWLTLKPKEKLNEITLVKLKVHSDDFLVYEIQLTDHLDNETTFLMSDMLLGLALKDGQFEEKIPANAIVERI